MTVRPVPRLPLTDAADPGPGRRDPRTAAPVLVRASEVTPETAEWLWPQRIPFGKLTLLDGDPGIGKSTLTLDIAARLTRGDPMPDGSRPALAGGVVILSAEDGAADTIRPRLDAAMAALEWVGIVKGVAYEDGGEDLLMLPDHVGAVRTAIDEVAARLVIVDPLAAYLGGTVDTHRDHHVRRALVPLHQLAEETGAAVLVLRHLRKSAGGPALYRGAGSIGIVGAARAALLAALDPDDTRTVECERRRVLAVVKASLARKAPSLGYRIVEAPNGAAAVDWLGTSQHDADALVAIGASEEERTALDEARAFLMGELEDGPRTAREMLAAARAAGIAQRTLARARVRQGVEARRVGGIGGTGAWLWELLGSKVAKPSIAGALGGLRGSDPAMSRENTRDSLRVPNAATAKDAEGVGTLSDSVATLPEWNDRPERRPGP